MSTRCGLYAINKKRWGDEDGPHVLVHVFCLDIRQVRAFIAPAKVAFNKLIPKSARLPCTRVPVPAPNAIV